jgi:hypothetical protein
VSGCPDLSDCIEDTGSAEDRDELKYKVHKEQRAGRIGQRAERMAYEIEGETEGKVQSQRNHDHTIIPEAVRVSARWDVSKTLLYGCLGTVITSFGLLDNRDRLFFSGN